MIPKPDFPYGFTPPRNKIGKNLGPLSNRSMHGCRVHGFAWACQSVRGAKTRPRRAAGVAPNPKKPAQVLSHRTHRMKMTSIEKHFVNGPARTRAVAREVSELLERIPVVPGSRLLDVGCGVGSAACAIAERGDLEVVGVDVDQAQIAAAQAAATRPNLRFLAMDATALTFRDAEFDIVASSMATHHIQRWERALSEMARVLRPGGYLIYIDLTFPDWLSRGGRLLGPLMSFPSIRRVESFAGRMRLAKIHQHRRGMQLHAIYRKPVE
jgi:SAM-dependent methyltransferase